MPTPFSFTNLAGDGVQTNFQFSFDYLSESHLFLEVDEVPTTVVLNSTHIMEIIPAPANGSVVRMFRETPLDERVVDFTNGSVLLESDLDMSALQMLFVAQETADLTGDLMSSDDGLTWNGQSRRITGVSAPVNDDDVATKAYTESFTAPAASSASASASNAAISETSAASSAASALASASSASSSATTASNAAASITGQTIGDHADVDASGLKDGDTLVRVGGEWVVRAAASVGDLKATWSSAEDGWLLANGQTLGFDGPSGADFTGSQYSDLYTFLWNNLPDAVAPVAGGRGASAFADYLGNKAIAIPDTRGRALVGAGIGTGLTQFRINGGGFGEEFHTQTLEEQGTHRHVIRENPASGTGSIVAGEGASGTQVAFISGTPMAWSQASIGANIMIKI